MRELLIKLKGNKKERLLIPGNRIDVVKYAGSAGQGKITALFKWGNIRWMELTASSERSCGNRPRRPIDRRQTSCNGKLRPRICQIKSPRTLRGAGEVQNGIASEEILELADNGNPSHCLSVAYRLPTLLSAAPSVFKDAPPAK
jgi:hypothetical protein